MAKWKKKKITKTKNELQKQRNKKKNNNKTKMASPVRTMVVVAAMMVSKFSWTAYIHISQLYDFSNCLALLWSKAWNAYGLVQLKHMCVTEYSVFLVFCCSPNTNYSPVRVYSFISWEMLTSKALFMHHYKYCTLKSSRTHLQISFVPCFLVFFFSILPFLIFFLFIFISDSFFC